MAFPTNPNKGDVHTEFGETYFFNSISWSKGFAKQINGVDCVFDHVAPTSPVEGLLFYNYSTNQLRRYTSGSWIVVTSL